MSDVDDQLERKRVISEAELISSLDDNWSTVSQIRYRFQRPVPTSAVVANALERLANSGQILRREETTVARARNGRKLALRLYRRRPT